MLIRFTRNLLTDRLSFKRYCQPIVLLSLVVVFGLPSLDSTSFTAASPCVAQTQPDPQEPSDHEKAMKYHSALMKRPAFGYLYHRFYNVWLDSSPVEELKKFLVERANAPDAVTADRLLLAFFYAKQGKDVDALKQFRVARKKDPDDVATLYEMAIIQARTLDFESALKNLGKAAQNNLSADEAIKIAQLRGKLLAQNRQAKEAVKVWDELVQSNPDDLGLLEDLIELQISEGMFKRAEALSDRLIAKTNDPFQKVVRQMRKGDLLRRGGNRSGALDIYGKTLAQAGMGTWIEREILDQIEQLFRREDDLIGLNQHLIKLTEANSRRVAIQKTRAKILIELGQVDEAIKAYEKIIELTPGSRESQEAFTKLLVTASKLDRAVKQMESLVAQYSKDAELQVQFAELCHKTSKPQKVQAALNQFVALSGHSEHSYLRTAKLFEKFGDLDNAKDFYESALERFQDSNSIKDAWADFLFRSGAKDDAVIVWRTLAKNADRSDLIRIARLVSVYQLNQVAFDLLLVHYDDFKSDSIYLGQLCSEAIILEKFSAAVAWSTERVRLAKTPSDVELALPQAILIIDAAQATEAVTQRLRAKNDRGAAETCLLVELLNRLSLTDETLTDVAESILISSFKASKDAQKNQDSLILARQRVRFARVRQDWVGAAAAARALIELPGGRKGKYVGQLIELYIRNGNDKLALQWIAEWKRLSPHSLLPWSNEATLLERAGSVNESIEVLRRATMKFPNNPDLHNQLAQRYLHNDQAKNAQRLYWRQYETSEKLSDKIRWAEELAKVANDKGEIDQLVQVFQERRRSNPQSIAPLLSIAQAHRISRNYIEQRSALMEAARLTPENLSLLFEIAALEEIEGGWEKAIQTLQRASSIDKTSHAKHRMAQLYLKLGETNQALAQLFEIAGGANSTADEIEKISEAIVPTESWQELLDFLTPQLARFPGNYRLRYLAAIANEELGNTRVANKQFLELLQFNQESPKVDFPENKQAQGKPGYSKQSVTQNASVLKRMLWETPSSAYSYRPNSKRGSVAGRWCLPSDLESCREFSVSHLCKMARGQPQETRVELQGQLERIGVQHANILLAEVSRDDIKKDITTLIEIDPNDQVALAIAMENQINVGSELPQEIYSKAFEAFKNSSPAHALYAAVKLDQTQPSNQARLEAAIERLKMIKEPDFSLACIIAGSRQPSLKKYRTEINQLLLSWYSKLSKQPQKTAWFFSIVVGSLAAEKSPIRLIEFLDDELNRLRQRGPQKQVFHQPLYSYQEPAATISLPTYPTGLFSFPAKVYGRLNLPVDQYPTAVNTAKDPTLKALLQLKYFRLLKQISQQQIVSPSRIAGELPDPSKIKFDDNVTDSKTAIDRLLKVTPTNIDAWYLAGALAVSEQRWADAATSFEALLRLPLTAKNRRKINGHLVALATLGLAGDNAAVEINNEKQDLVVMSSKSAALRLRLGELSQAQRVQLVSAFKMLDLGDEVEELENAIATAADAGDGCAARFYAPRDQISKLNQAGKTEAVIDLISQELRGFARQELNFNSMKYRHRGWPEFTEKVANLRIKDQLVKRFSPLESTNDRELGVCAFAQEFFGDKDVARSIYKELLEGHPQDNAIRLKHLISNLQTADERFSQEFSKVAKRFRAMFLEEMLMRMAEASSSPQEELSLIESAVAYKEGDDGDSIDDRTMGRLLEAIASARFVFGHRQRTVLPEIYTIYTKRTSHDPRRQRALKEREALCQRHRILHDRVALGLTDSIEPWQAAKGFTALLASAEAVAKPVDDQMVALALKTVYPIKNSPANLRPYYYKRYDAGRWAQKRSPVQFLARHYGLSGNDDEQIELIANRLDSLGYKGDAAELQGTYRLYRANEDEFVPIANELIATVKGNSKRPIRWKWENQLFRVYQVWKDRQLQSDISSLWIDYAARKFYPQPALGLISPNQSDDDPVIDFLREFAKENDVAMVENFMARLRRKRFGSEKEQRELAKIVANRRLGSPPSEKLIAADIYNRIARSLNSRKTFWLGLQEVQRFNSLKLRQPDRANDIQKMMLNFTADEIDSMLDWLEQSSVLADLKDFDPFPISGDKGTYKSSWGEVLRESMSMHSSRWKSRMAELSKKLSQRTNRTFGESVMLAFALEKPANIYQLIGLDLQSFLSLPLKQQVKLAKFASEVNEINISQFGKEQMMKLPTSKEGQAAQERCSQLEIEAVKSKLEIGAAKWK